MEEKGEEEENKSMVTVLSPQPFIPNLQPPMYPAYLYI